MKLIPCKGCGTTALGPKTEKFPNGAPMVVGSVSTTLVFKCQRCKMSYKVGVKEFNSLPPISEQEALTLV